MPPEAPPSEITPEEIEQQLKKICKSPLMQGSLRRHALRWLIAFKAAGKYDQKPRPRTHKIFDYFYKYALDAPHIDLTTIPTDTLAAGNNLFGELADALEEYYKGPGAEDSIIITLLGGIGGGYEPNFERRRAPVPEAPDDDLLQAFVGTFHVYHLSENNERQPAWWYKAVTLLPGESAGTLTGRAWNVPKAGAVRQKKHEYDYEVSLDHGHLILWVHQVDQTPDVSVVVFPDASTDFPLSGVAINTKTWANNPVSSICILSDSELECALGAIDGEPISNPKIMMGLETAWEERAQRVHLFRLPPGHSGDYQRLTVYPAEKHQGEFYKWLRRIERASAKSQEELDAQERYGDLRILTTYIVSPQEWKFHLDKLFNKRVRTKMLVMDPTKAELMSARFAARKDRMTPEKVKPRLVDLIEDLPTWPSDKTLLELRVSDLMPCAFVAHSGHGALVGLMPAHGSYLEGPMIEVPPNTAFWDILYEDWKTRWDRVEELQKRPRLPRQEIISDAHLIMQVERHTPETKSNQIWLAAHNLQNVGEATSSISTIVRNAVMDNAKRGIHYTYVYPERASGTDRVKKLENCFKPGKEDQLHLHALPDDRFQEITLVDCHFISFNPLDNDGVLNEEADVYMQLPMDTVDKGWIKLDDVSALRVLRTMQRLMTEFPDKRPPKGRSQKI